MNFRGLLLVPFATCLLLLGSCEFGWAPGDGGGGTEGQGVSLSGHLVTGTGAPLAGATVRIYPVDSAALAKGSADLSELVALAKAESLQTDANGRFAFSSVEKGTYDLIATGRQGDQSFSLIRRNLILDKNTYLGIDTVQASGSLLVQVRVAGGGLVAGAVCEISGTPWTVYSNDQGECAFTGLPPGTFRVAVRHISYPDGKSPDITVISGGQANGGTVELGEEPDPGPGPGPGPGPVEPPDSGATGTHFESLPSTVALWTFDAYEGDMVRDQKGSFHLTPSSAIPLESSPFGSAAVFDGATKRFSVPYNDLLNVGGTGKLTYEARIYMSQYPAASNFKSRTTLVGLYAGIALQILSDGSINLKAQKLAGSTAFWYDTLTTAPGIVPLGRWVDVALAVDTTVLPRQVYAYVDGTPVQLYGTASNNSFRIYSAPFTIGGDSQDGQSFNGKIDEVRVSNALVLGAGLPILPKTSLPPASGNGLLAHFAFDEAAGASAYSTGSAALAAASVNGAQWTAGVQGSALAFNGTTNSVVLQDAQALTGMSKLTVESWVNLTQYGGPYQRIAAVWSGSVAAWTLTVFDDGYFGIEVYAGSSANEDKGSRSNRRVPLNEWAHLAGVYSGDSIILYLNGERVYAQPSIKKTLPLIQQRLEVGCILSPTNGSVTFSWPGSIDELKIYDTALTDAQVLESYLANRLAAPVGKPQAR